MRNQLAILSCVAVALALLGCQSSPSEMAEQPDRDAMLAEVRQSLVDGQLDLASRRLEELDREHGQGGIAASPAFQLMAAELALRQGDVERAAASIESLLEKRPESPHASEVLGKVMLNQGQFDGAERRFAVAAQQYTDREDRQRASSLVHLARGLDHYNRAELRAAQQQWEQIEDSTVRRTLEKTLGQIGTAQLTSN